MKKIILLFVLLIPINVKGYESAVVDINELSINQIQEYVDKGFLTYEKIIRLYLDRIEAYNKQYNAIITINENALEEAKKLDIEYKKHGRTSPIYGLPVIVKDNIDVEGLPTTNGTKALLDSIPYKNSTVVQKLIDNKAIIIAKSNMAEFTFNASNSYSSFGHVHNAFDETYSSYGSSGGSAVAVASNLAVFALGSDTGVSIRVPSSANGVIGIRPSYEIISNDGVIKFESTRDVVGVITKYVEDSAIVLDIIDNVETKYTDYLGESLNDVTIGVIKGFMDPLTNSTSTGYGKTDKFIYDMVNESIKYLEKLGAKIVYLDNFDLTYEFDASNLCYEFNNYLKGTSSKIKSLDDLIKNGGYTQNLKPYNNNYCNNDYKQTKEYKDYIDNRNNNIKKANNIFDKNNLDAIIYPTIKTELIKLKDLNSTKLYTPSSNTAPLIGWPAISIPMGFYNDLPYGIEIMAKANDEKMVYKIASSFEKINKLYKTPSIAPSLYKTPDNLNKLLAYYQDYKDNNRYLKINEEVKKFIIDYDNDEDKINYFILKYETKADTNQIYEINISLFTILIIIFILIFKKVKNEKVKRTNKL